jgi:heme oxygenase
VDPARSAAGRLGGHRVHELAVLGREYEKEHGLTPGRERLKHLIKLGRRYEVEHGLRAAQPRRRKKGDAWQEFVAALARVVKPAHRAAVEQLAAALRSNSTPGADRAA